MPEIFFLAEKVAPTMIEGVVPPTSITARTYRFRRRWVVKEYGREPAVTVTEAFGMSV